MKKIIFIALLATTISCSDFLEITPISSIVVENYYQTEADAENAINAVYSMLISHHLYNQYHEVIQSQGTDDCEWGKGRTTSNPGKNELDKFLYTSSSTVIHEYWVASYKVINAANSVIVKVANMDIDSDKKDQFIGEAQFLRALIYFNMVRLYGDVPLVTVPTTSLEGLEIAKEPAENVYNTIINDFAEASEKLPLSYGSLDIGRATKGAALTLLCKVYLNQERYIDAKNTAELVSVLGEYSLENQYADIFTTENENGPESIFEIQYMITDEGGLGSSYAGFMAPPTQGGYGDNPVTKNHYDIYETGDYRKEVNVFHDLTAASFILEPYYVNKYTERGPNVLENGDNYIITRYADLLLMHAEALNALDNSDSKAYDLFNQVRRRAYGLPYMISSSHDLQEGLSQEQFLDSILLERRKEFAFEGHRRFDLLRTEKLIEAMQIADPSLPVRPKHMLFPIPQIELLANLKLLQNDEWE